MNELSNKAIEAIADKVAERILARLNVPSDKELVTTEEAAKILHISKEHLRLTKDRYRYKRDTAHGPILFLRSSLYR